MSKSPFGSKTSRDGTAAVEFAVVAPVLLLLILGTCEMGQALAGATKIASAIREGGRLASMDFSGKLESGQTANQKVEQDVLNFLEATGVRTENVILTIEHAEGDSVGSTFDLADADNYMRLFRIAISVPYANVSANPVNLMGARRIESATVFRRGRTPVNYETE